MTDDDGLGPARERTEDLLAALDRGDVDGLVGVRAMLTYLGRRGEIGVMLVTWAQLLAVWPYRSRALRRRRHAVGGARPCPGGRRPWCRR